MISEPTTPARADDDFDYIIVGSGAGGGPLAARLAQAGCRVLVIEAGADVSQQASTAPAREVSQVPSFHAVSTEQADLSWQFFVKHYDTPPCGPDSKADARGIFYPRAAALGGCTVHNAMITVAGPDSDWDDLADFLADDSWSAAGMRPYFQRLERNEYLPAPEEPPSKFIGRLVDSVRWLFGADPDYTAGRHGFTGWLRTSWADVSVGLHDVRLVKMLKAALEQVEHDGIERFGALTEHFIRGTGKPLLDPNHALRQAENPAGLALIPLAVCGKNNPIDPNAPPEKPQRGRRSGPREFLLEVQKSHPQNLVIWTERFVTKVLFERDETGQKLPRARGVEYLEGSRLYAAHPGPRNRPSGAPKEVFAKREIILCGGTFNTPQLLMLSGIGERAQLDAHGIECLVDSPGVGCNLHDRYEVCVLSEMDAAFPVLEGASLGLPTDPADPDPVLKAWREQGTGLYTSNGSVIGILKRSRPDLAQPDLFIFGLPLPFEGYKAGYSDVHKNYPDEQYRRLFTWAILKSHTRNRDGTVRLMSGDPLARPEINFHYFQEVSKPVASATDPDLAALVEGVKFVRAIAQRNPFVKSEFYPGPDVQTDDEIKQWAIREAWGHHACGTCRMGPEGDTKAVLDSRFQVRGVSGLRVVDASIFPKIPGYFIVTNIYISSEKAAAVILEDQKFSASDSVVYPRELRAMETAAVRERRRQFGPAAGEKAESPALHALTGDESAWPDDVTGLALSGGGIRSATWNLGILQALARGRQLRRADFLSTVSGGGYIGSFLGRFYDHLRNEPLTDSGRHSMQPAVDRVERELIAPDSKELGWLRKNANYIAPSGGDARYELAVLIRNLVSVHFVVGALLFTLFGIANALRYFFFDPASTVLIFAGGLTGGTGLPLGSLLGRALGVFWSPWFILFELLLLFLVVPRIVGYWIASQEETERYHWPGLALLFLLLAVLLYLGVGKGLNAPALWLACSLMSSFVAVEVAWWRGRVREEAVGTGGAETQRLRTRNYLTYDLGLGLSLASLALGFALIDAIGHGLQQWAAGSRQYAAAFASLGAAVMAAMPVLRKLAGIFSEPKKKAGPPSTIARLFKAQASAGLLALVLGLLPLTFFSFASHAAFQGGVAVIAGAAATAFTLIISLILANDDALPFVNRSSLAATYAGQLARTFLGASNPLRHHPTGANVSEVMSGDDVASLRDYQPQAAGGPVHLINVTVNQTIEFTSQRGNRDRKGENMAVTSLGFSIGRKWHGLWRNAPCGSGGKEGSPLLAQAAVGQMPQSLTQVSVQPLGYPPASGPDGERRYLGKEHPLVDETGAPAQAVEMLSLRQWIGISGAAVGPGRGQSTQLGTALLFGLANLRTGYWWDSGIAESARDGFPDMSFTRRLLYLLPKFFITQSLLIFEWIARYPGPWERFWYLSDGGFFENLGGYELIRRQVPRIIVTDAGADPSYEFGDLADLVRKARIDFQARIEPVTDLEAAGVPEKVRPLLGSVSELRPPMDGDGNITGPSPKQAALFYVHYENSPGARPSILLYLKATVTKSVSADVANYHAAHLEFPHEDTADQAFNEAQWESYRKLGEDTATSLFSLGNWFWEIPRPAAV